MYIYVRTDRILCGKFYLVKPISDSIYYGLVELVTANTDTSVCLFQIYWKNGKYNLISVCFNAIRKRILCVRNHSG